MESNQDSQGHGWPRSVDPKHLGGRTGGPSVPHRGQAAPSAIASTAATAPAPRTHREEEEGERHQVLLPIDGVVGVLQEVGGLLVNQAVGVTRDAGGAGCPPCGHGHAPR